MSMPRPLNPLHESSTEARGQSREKCLDCGHEGVVIHLTFPEGVFCDACGSANIAVPKDPPPPPEEFIELVAKIAFRALAKDKQKRRQLESLGVQEFETAESKCSSCRIPGAGNNKGRHMYPAEEIRVAYHESGHAIACFHRSIRFSYVTMNPDSITASQRRKAKSPWQDLQPDAQTDKTRFPRAEGNAIASCAGPAAERKHTNQPGYVNADDYPDLQAVLSWALLAKGKDQVEAYSNYLWRKANNIMDHPPSWAAVEALASELLEQRVIKYREARKTISDQLTHSDRSHVQ